MKSNIIAGIICFFLVFVLGLVFVPILKKIKAGQPILKYVEEHKEKSGTPTMGGLLFILPSVIIFFIFGGEGKIALVSIAIGLAYMLVGFLDDFIKIKLKHNEGLKPYQKILFQTSIAVFAGIFAYVNGITLFFVPFFKLSVNLGWASIPIVAIIFLSITNCVNLTDGLDGLAGGVSVVYLAIFSLLITLQIQVFEHMYLDVKEYENLIKLSVILCFSILAFLVFNVSKANVFMGDTGSLSIGGFIGAISIFSSNSFFIPIIGIMFVVSGISVIIQVVHYKKTKKRVFLMAPFHHHLQLKGYSEAKISFCYSVITLIFGLLVILFVI